LARKSNTEPVLVMRIEARDEVHLAQIRSTVEQRVSSMIDLEKLLNA